MHGFSFMFSYLSQLLNYFCIFCSSNYIYVTGGQVVYGKALDIMVELLKNTKDEKVLLAQLSWFKTISELEDEREVSITINKNIFHYL